MVTLKSQYEWSYGHLTVKKEFQPPAILLFNWPELNFMHLQRMTKGHSYIMVTLKSWVTSFSSGPLRFCRQKHFFGFFRFLVCSQYFKFSFNFMDWQVRLRLYIVVTKTWQFCSTFHYKSLQMDENMGIKAYNFFRFWVCFFFFPFSLHYICWQAKWRL